MNRAEKKYLTLLQSGVSRYADMWSLQKDLFSRVEKDRDEQFLILTEHHPVITIGKSADMANLVSDTAYLQKQGIELFEIDRGGDLTFHGPGQIVAYPILDLQQFRKDIHWYLRSLEEVIIRTLAYFGVKGHRIDGLTGVWVEDEKICAMGIKVTRWVTMHGFALNVLTNLNYFQHIIPCGIHGKGVTSISDKLGNIISLNDVNKQLIDQFETVFDIICRPADISNYSR